MEFTLNTEVKDILNHKKVLAEMDAVVPKVRELIQNRWDTMQAQMADGSGLSKSQTVNGESIFYNDARTIALEYTLGFWSDFNWSISLMRDKTFEKEAEELHAFEKFLTESNNNSGTSDEQKKINNEKISEIYDRLRILKDSIMNDDYREWDDTDYKDFMLEQCGLTEPPTEPPGEPVEYNDPTEPETTPPQIGNGTEPPTVPTEPPTVPTEPSESSSG